jgi:restriction endonuclease
MNFIPKTEKELRWEIFRALLPYYGKIVTPAFLRRKNGDIIYMIRETKATKDQMQLRGFENAKIKCGARHFETIGVDYDVVTSISDANL